MSLSPLVSVITINWNNIDFIESCLQHVFAQGYPRIEIIVVDNGSEDGSYEMLLERYAGLVNLIRLATNTGFTGGMNAGIAQASGDYVLFLNSDAFLDAGYVTQVISEFERPENARIGVIGGKLYTFSNGLKTQIVDSVGLFLKLRMAVRNSSNADNPEFVFGVSGACPTVRRTLLDEVQLSPGEWFDADYFAYNEDIDLWFRTHLLGWKILFLPTAFGWHVRSGSVGGQRRLYERSPLLQYHALKNRYITILKDYPAALLLMTTPFLCGVEVSTFLFFAVVSRGTLPSMFRAQRYVVKNLPDIIRCRRQIQRTRLVTSWYFLPFYRGP